MITRATLSTIEQGLPKYRSMLAGNAAYAPPAFESIATQTITSSTSSVTFSGIPGTYKHLQLRAFMTHSSTSQSSVGVRCNGDTGSNYSYRYLYNFSGTVYSTSANSQTSANILTCVGGTNLNGVGIVDIYEYANTSIYKTLRAFSGASDNGSTGGVKIGSGLWMASSAITSLTVFNYGGTFENGAIFALYGIKG